VTAIEVDAINGSLPYAFYGMVSVEHTRHDLKNPGVNYRHSIRRKEGLEEGYAIMLLTKDLWKGMEDECPPNSPPSYAFSTNLKNEHVTY